MKYLFGILSKSIWILLSSYKSRFEPPHVGEGSSLLVQIVELLSGIGHDLFGNCLMESALDINVLAAGIGEMAAE